MRDERMIDANVNRSAEGIRVLEDIARFHFDNQRISAQLRSIRHGVREIFSGMEQRLLAARDAREDVGVQTSFTQKSDTRRDIRDGILSNGKRVQEAFRSLEEILKIGGHYPRAKEIERLRYSAYSLEKDLMSSLVRVLPPGIYGILGEKFSLGRTNVQVAREMVEAGVAVLQYREKVKEKSKKEILRECQEIRRITSDGGVPFIVNDHADVALMVGADGIHQGQDDLPVKELRAIAPQMMLGCSTHSPEQARQAIEDGADYIGVGPIYTTQTKEDVCDAVGLEYLEHVADTHVVDFVAIGGIKRDNLEAVLARGARTVCLVTEIIGAEDIKGRIHEIKEIIGRTR